MSTFHFKQFSVKQENCAMKIGTDGVLLGAWAKIPEETSTILDIGAGTGLIALMLAQRTADSKWIEAIDGVEINPEAHQQCVDNFENSPWNHLLFCYHASLKEFDAEFDETYDLIISNPPFYEEDEISAQKARATARSTQALSFIALIRSAEKLLSQNGVFQVIIPSKSYTKFTQICLDHNLFLERCTWVKGTATSPIKRCLLSFSKTPKQNIIENTLILEEKRHTYTKDYQDLIKDFYLKA